MSVSTAPRRVGRKVKSLAGKAKTKVTRKPKTGSLGLTPKEEKKIRKAQSGYPLYVEDYDQILRDNTGLRGTVRKVARGVKKSVRFVGRAALRVLGLAGTVVTGAAKVVVNTVLIGFVLITSAVVLVLMGLAVVIDAAYLRATWLAKGRKTPYWKYLFDNSLKNVERLEKVQARIAQWVYKILNDEDLYDEALEEYSRLHQVFDTQGFEDPEPALVEGIVLRAFANHDNPEVIDLLWFEDSDELTNFLETDTGRAIRSFELDFGVTWDEYLEQYDSPIVTIPMDDFHCDTPEEKIDNPMVDNFENEEFIGEFYMDSTRAPVTLEETVHDLVEDLKATYFPEPHRETMLEAEDRRIKAREMANYYGDTLVGDPGPIEVEQPEWSITPVDDIVDLIDGPIDRPEVIGLDLSNFPDLDDPHAHDWYQYLDQPEVAEAFDLFAARAADGGDRAEFSYWTARSWARTNREKHKWSYNKAVALFVNTHDKREFNVGEVRRGIKAEVEIALKMREALRTGEVSSERVEGESNITLSNN